MTGVQTCALPICFPVTIGVVGWGEVINGGFGVLLDGSEDADRRLKSMLFWDVNNGISRRSWERNEGAIFAIRRAMEAEPNLKVTFKFGSASIARFIAKIAPSFLAQLLLEIPLFTSQKSIDFNRRSASSEPSNNIPKPPLITSPQPTPPPL